MDRILSCECGRQHIVSRSQAGQEITCECGRIHSVPSLRGLADLPVAQTPIAAPGSAAATASQTDRNAWQGWRGITMAVASAGFLIALLACGWFSMQRLAIDTSYTVEKEIAAGDEMLDKTDPALLSSVWFNFGLMSLRNKQPPQFFLWNLYAADRVRLATNSGAIAAGFGAIALAVWVSTKRKTK